MVHKFLICIIQYQRNGRQHDGSKQASKKPWKSVLGNILRGSSNTEGKLTPKHIKDGLGQSFSNTWVVTLVNFYIQKKFAV